MMNKICELAFDSAINAIKDSKYVMYRHGVWNRYEKVPTEHAIKYIRTSGYGADVFERDNMFYVSIPCDSDMW